MRREIDPPRGLFRRHALCFELGHFRFGFGTDTGLVIGLGLADARHLERDDVLAPVPDDVWRASIEKVVAALG